VGAMIQRLGDYGLVDKPDLEAFMEDQAFLTEHIIYRGRRATASVPIRYNGNHSSARWRNKSVLPVMLATRRVPPTRDRRPHDTYYLIVYVEVDESLRSIREVPGVRQEPVG